MPIIDGVYFQPMDNVFDFFGSKGFLFSEETLTRYVLSLKTKPFVILSGISGTGKTKIAQLFADYICQNCTEAERRHRIAFISVRPDWLDNRGLLGYHNMLDQKYYSTKLLRLLLQAGKENEKPFFVILDEMNLAKVEHYFSDFLSVMESRTTDHPEGETLRLHDISDNVHDTQGNNIPAEIHIPSNVYFTGTVNVDETTYMFSPKVLDRANVIEFNEVDLLNIGPIGANSAFQFKLPRILDSFHDQNSRSFSTLQDFKDCRAKEAIAFIKNELEPSHHHFGYRVANEVGRFINFAEQLVGKEEVDSAIDIQILQKVLPKLHGTRGKLESPLIALKQLCAVRNYKRSESKLGQMIHQLMSEGYCSFIQ